MGEAPQESDVRPRIVAPTARRQTDPVGPGEVRRDQGHTWFIGLPGNPEAAFFMSLLLVQPVILAMLDASPVFSVSAASSAASCASCAGEAMLLIPR